MSDDAAEWRIQDEPSETVVETIARLAGLSAADYETVRRAEAKRLDWRISRLDGEVETAREVNRPPPIVMPDPRGRPDLVIDDAELPDTAADLAKHLARLPMLFNRGGPARLRFDPQRGGMVVELLTAHGVTNEAHDVCRPCRLAEKDGVTYPHYITLPDRVAKLYLDRQDRQGLRPLDGITCAPLLHDDGTIRTAEGYDEATRLWCEKVPSVAVPPRPTENDARSALLQIRTMFRTFVFADAPRISVPDCAVSVVDVSAPPGTDESAFLVSLMAALCRPSLPLAPGLIVRAPQFSGAGTGKGLLVRAICAVAFGAAPRAMTAGHDPAELEKRIAAALVEADFALFLDNLNSMSLKSDTLASAITERPAYVRPLGRTGTVPLNSSAFVAVTGNGLSLSEDMARRFVMVELDSGTENPEARPFAGDFLATIRAHRADLLCSLLTIWRWGRLTGDALPAGHPLGSFTQWGRWCRDPLLALGCRDPAEKIVAVKAQDPRRANLTQMFNIWWQRHSDKTVAVSELHQDVTNLADPQSRGRQFLATKVRNLVGTRLGGFVLNHHSTDGKWSADKYSLSQTAGGAETHRDHRGHRGV
jgi:hypothetical protein